MARAFVTIIGSLACSALLYCGGRTAGETIRYEASAVGAVRSSTASVDRFTTASGWTIELEVARVMVGPLYFYGGGQRAARSLPLGLPTAYAHPADDTFDKGPVLGDVLDQYVVDLLAAPTDLGIVPGLKGTMSTMEIQLHPPGFTALGSPVEALEAMRDQTFVLEGTATKGGRSVPFVAEGHLGDTTGERTIESIDATVDLVDRDERAGRLFVEVYVDDWLRFVDFGALTKTDDEGRYLVDPDSRPGASLIRGIRSRFAYDAQWRTP